MKKFKATIMIVLFFLLIIPTNVYAATYEYDELNRVKVIIYDNGDKEEYFYDSAGNIVEIKKTYASNVLNKIVLDKDVYILNEGEECNISPLGEYVDGSKKELSGIMYSSSDKNIFKVSNSGKITALKAGEGRVKVISNGKETTAIVKVMDNTKPTTPSNLKLISKGAHTIRLSWDESTDNTEIDKYIVYCNNKKIQEADRLTFVKTSFSPGTTYSFKVTAVDIYGNESDFSQELIVITDSGIPTTPTNFKCYFKGANTIRLSWDASSDNVKVEKYIIYRDDKKAYETTNLSFVRTSFQPGTTYRFRISAVDNEGNESELSEEIVVTTNSI